MQAIKYYHDIFKPKNREGNDRLFCLWLVNPLTHRPSDFLSIVYGNAQVRVERLEGESDIDYVNRTEAEAKKLYDLAMYKDNFAVIEPKMGRNAR